jgi:hypothetical protein
MRAPPAQAEALARQRGVNYVAYLKYFTGVSFQLEYFQAGHDNIAFANAPAWKIWVFTG